MSLSLYVYTHFLHNTCTYVCNTHIIIIIICICISIYAYLSLSLYIYIYIYTLWVLSYKHVELNEGVSTQTMHYCRGRTEHKSTLSTHSTSHAHAEPRGDRSLNRDGPLPKTFSPFPHDTCLLSVSNLYLVLDEIYHPLCAPTPRNATL